MVLELSMVIRDEKGKDLLKCKAVYQSLDGCIARKAVESAVLHNNVDLDLI